ncbi:MAG: hypothetical protein SOX95_02205 [Lachnospiraceae bacterium]|nr:hypothetical protein [Lachnospiraceae bacterium]
MRKNKILAIICSVSLLGTMLVGCGQQDADKAAPDAQTDSSDARSSIEEMDSVVQSMEAANLITHSDSSGKEETVYVLLDANGNKTDTIVSEWLKNPEGAQTMYDSTKLKDVEVVKGNASYTQDDDMLVWNSDGGDIYYQGKSDKEVPVNVEVTYTLNDAKVDATEIDHASGHLVVNYNYTNNCAGEMVIDGERRTVYQPFAMMTGMMLDNEKVSNIEVTNGKAINSGDYTIVFGMAMPGLAESLGIDSDEIEIPESVIVEADVQDFSMPMTVTVASNNALSELGLDEFDSVDELKDKAGQLNDGINMLSDGAGQLNDGIITLSDGTDSLKDGTVDLVSGVGALNDGAVSLSDGAGKLSDGTKKLSGGATQVNDGAGALKDGIHKLKDNTPALESGVNDLSSGAAQLNAGLSQINTNSEELKNGAKSLVEGADQLATDLNSLSNSVTALSNGATGVSDGATQAEDDVDEVLKVYESVVGNLNGILETLDTQIEDLESLPDDATEAQKQAAQEELNTLNPLKDNIDGCLSDLNSVKPQTERLSQPMPTLASDAATLDSGINQGLVTSLTQAQAAAKALSTGATNLQQGIKAYTDGVVSCTDGAKKLNDGLIALKGQLPALSEGLNKLTDGADSLAAGTDELAKGAGELVTGSSTLADGAMQLADGTGRLNDGSIELKDGVIRLSDGVYELLDGSGQLKEGVEEYRTEGIDKITDLVNNNIEKYYDRLCAVRDYAGEYTSFAGSGSDTDSSVKFIIKTDAVN